MNGPHNRAPILRSGPLDLPNPVRSNPGCKTLAVTPDWWRGRCRAVAQRVTLPCCGGRQYLGERRKLGALGRRPRGSASP